MRASGEIAASFQNDIDTETLSKRPGSWCSEWFTFTGTSRVRFILWSVIYAVSLMNSADAESKLIDANGCVSLAAYHPRLKRVIRCL